MSIEATDPVLKLLIRLSNAEKVNVECGANDTILDLKVAIEKVLSVPPVNQRLIYKGKVLKDDLQLSSYGK